MCRGEIRRQKGLVTLMAFRERFFTDYLDPLQAEAQADEIVAILAPLVKSFLAE